MSGRGGLGCAAGNVREEGQGCQGGGAGKLGRRGVATHTELSE